MGQTLNIRHAEHEVNVACPRMNALKPSLTGVGSEYSLNPPFPPQPPAGGWPDLLDTPGPRQWRSVRSVADRLYSNTNPNGPEMRHGLGRCWVWLGYRIGSKQDRGAISWSRRYGNRPVYVNRVAWELFYGPIPDGQQVNHHCDNPVCVRLDHLYLGTQLDNMRDASRRGRFHVPRTTRVLTPDEREAIYALPARRGLVRDLAAQYGVSEACISRIRKGRFVRLGRTA